MRDLIDLHRPRFVDLKLVDLAGRIRHVTLPVEAVDASLMEAGVGFDGSSYGFKKVQASDMVMVPDLSTGHMDPFRELPTLSFFCNAHLAEDGLPLSDQDTRGVLQRAVARLTDMGLADEVLVAPEYEFYVFDSAEAVSDTCHCAFFVEGSEAGRSKAYHEINPADRHVSLRDQAVAMLVDHGMKVKYHHHEVGPHGQHEIESNLEPVLKAADNGMMLKYVLSNLAARQGLKVTFMPKPLYGQAGNGWHVHMMLLRDGQNLFYDPAGDHGLSREAMGWMAGILSHGRSLAALTNASTNSYKRLTPGFEAPVALTYGPADRTAAIRIPRWARGPGTRLEYRPGDFTGNPYLMLAGLIMAGLDGVERGLDPVALGYGPAENRGAGDVSFLPFSLEEACDCLEADQKYLLHGDVFSPALLERWLASRREAAAAVAKRPHPHEYQLYFDP